MEETRLKARRRRQLLKSAAGLASRIDFKKVTHTSWHYFIKVFGPGLTIAALILSIIQLRQAKRAEQESNETLQKAREETQRLADQYKEIASKYKDLSESVSTKYETFFPQNMPAIIRLFERTQNSLTVVTDVAAYGHFS